MPGHKRKCEDPTNVWNTVRQMDITEITDYDNLHAPQGIIRQSMDNLKEIYHTRESWYLVNGSTVGILAAISSVCQPGDKIVIGRNCHKAVYNAVRLLRLHAVYLYPRQSRDYDILLDIGMEERKELKRILEENVDVKAVVLTSPTYEGVVTDISSIRELLDSWSQCEDRVCGKPALIVDEAHGAHFPFHDAFPRSAVECGADIVIQSVHKTLPALTQTALLHLCSDCVSPQILSDWLSVYETSSPSYPLMASAEYAVAYMHEKRENVDKYVDNLCKFRKKCGQLRRIRLIDPVDISAFAYDIGKLVFSVTGIADGGRWLFIRLRDEWNIELEMEARSYAIAMTSVMDEEEDFEILWRAIRALDEELNENQEKNADGRSMKIEASYEEIRRATAKPCIEPWEINPDSVVKVPLEKSPGRIAASYVMLYPPGIPLLVPGEKIVKEMVENLKEYHYNGYNVQGLADGLIPIMK